MAKLSTSEGLGR